MTRHRTDREPNAARQKPGVAADADRRLGRSPRILYGGVCHLPLRERFTRLLNALPTQGTADQTSDREGSR